jgi:hypothetical protein
MLPIGDCWMVKPPVFFGNQAGGLGMSREGDGTAARLKGFVASHSRRAWAGFDGEERLPAGDAAGVGPLAAVGVEDAVFRGRPAPESTAEDEFGREGFFEGFAGGAFRQWRGAHGAEGEPGAEGEEEDGGGD